MLPKNWSKPPEKPGSELPLAPTHQVAPTKSPRALLINEHVHCIYTNKKTTLFFSSSIPTSSFEIEIVQLQCPLNWTGSCTGPRPTMPTSLELLVNSSVAAVTSFVAGIIILYNAPYCCSHGHQPHPFGMFVVVKT